MIDGRGPRASFCSRLFSFFLPDAPAAKAARTLDWTCARNDESRRYADADRDLDDEVALDVHRQAQVQALADGLLEARGGGELVVLLRGGDAFDCGRERTPVAVPLTPSSRAQRRARRRRRSEC